MWEVHFTQKFVRGILKDLCHTDKIRFPSRELAWSWYEGILLKCNAGKLEYTLVWVEVRPVSG